MKTKNLKQFTVLSLLVVIFTMHSFESNAQSNKEKNHSEKVNHEGKEEDEHKENRETKMMKIPHERDYKSGEGEEGGADYKINEIYNVTKKGIQLLLKYNKTTNEFKGFIQNKTSKSIERARVEIHLSNGIELGPTIPMTLKSRQKKEIIIKATEKGFSSWSTHVEVGSNEHGHIKDGGNKKRHNEREKSEHGKKRNENEGHK